MIQAFKIAKSFGLKTLFHEATFVIGKGEKVGLVGRNGSGKSTLMKILTGELVSDGGEVVIPKNYTIGRLEQHLVFTKDNIVDECMSALGEEFEFERFRAEKILSGLGFEVKDFTRPPTAFSGGQQIRLQLTKLLLKEPQMLLLDEPTNYLDLPGLKWLSQFLRSYPHEVMLITHNRHFMDRIITHTLGIHGGKVRKVTGQTEQYYQQLESEAALLQSTQENLQQKIEHLEKFVTRFKAKASKATQAQSKQKSLDKLKDELNSVEMFNDQKNMRPRFQFAGGQFKQLMHAEDVAFHYVEGHDLFKNISFYLNAGDRLAIAGANGKGKTTLLDCLYGLKEKTNGTIQTHSQALKNYFGQTNIQRMSDNHTILQELASTNLNLTIQQVRALAGAMGFQSDDAEKKISVLSGGEKSRVLLAKMMASPSHLIFLDEPTHHLDIESVEELMQALETFPGALVFVTHDEEMLHRCANKIIYFTEKGAIYFSGTYEEWLEKEAILTEEIRTPLKNARIIDDKGSYEQRQEQKKMRRNLERRQEKVLVEIEECEAESDDLEEEMSEAAQAGDYQQGQKIHKEKMLLQQKIDKLYEEFEKITSDLEALPEL
jgi:ATP-binding cassette, subfamily F, member 3